jgi:TrmH family RNA methyltransferase
LRGAMGAAFRLPVWTGVELRKAMDWCRDRKIQMICADSEAAKLYFDVDWRLPTALILGPEAAGLSAEAVAAASASVRIPMKGLTESLNVAVAAGIILFEAARQR